MSFAATTPSAAVRTGSQAHRWLAARPENRVGIEFQDGGFRLVAARIGSHCDTMDSPELRVQWLHRVAEETPDIVADVPAYLDALAARLPRFATRGGVATSIALPPSVQSLRCVPSTQLAEAERGIADELQGEVQCRSWPVGAQKSMLCGVRRDVAEALIGILRDIGYRCESILPRSIALARTQLTGSHAKLQNATILCWERQRSLVTMIHDSSIRLCREFLIHEQSPYEQVQGVGQSDYNASGSDAFALNRLSRITAELASETLQTLQHAARLDSRASAGPIIVCGTMSSYPAALDSLRNAIDLLIGQEVEPWQIVNDLRSNQPPNDDADLANAVAVSLAVSGSKIAIDALQVGGKGR